jgi:hypothetical protein
VFKFIGLIVLLVPQVAQLCDFGPLCFPSLYFGSSPSNFLLKFMLRWLYLLMSANDATLAKI